MTIRAARVITEIAAPWVVLVSGSCVLGTRVGAPGWGVVTGMGMGGVPQAAIAWSVRRKRLSDHHVTRREERPLVITGIASSVAALMVAQRREECPDELRRLTNAAMAALVIAGGITASVTKVSFHTAVWSGMTTVLALEDDRRWWWGGAAVPAIAWARIRLGHHTATQTAVGVTLGVAAGVTARGR